jgi:hypothetical protein
VMVSDCPAAIQLCKECARVTGAKVTGSDAKALQGVPCK